MVVFKILPANDKIVTLQPRTVLGILVLRIRS